jgi:hypothetical protein
MVAGIGGGFGIELAADEPDLDWPHRGDSVVCGAVLGSGGNFDLSNLYG